MHTPHCYPVAQRAVARQTDLLPAMLLSEYRVVGLQNLGGGAESGQDRQRRPGLVGWNLHAEPDSGLVVPIRV